ncbi:calcium-binding protein [Cavenderia fasciculata]|uniref:Calcium-binding protein n=1 Tax=Cavenderia fasciculata TaxID=261658 RepID=F4PTL0_CACFS|nr:calcium-binding protein [Cavenderia fasciculata]EGG20892.1 calcium-binding protein [Cavenderia fasciculata]|eukprot:XP_004358742.1 calcium-binding protein [Cavenderia fasciculata]
MGHANSKLSKAEMDSISSSSSFSKNEISKIYEEFKLHDKDGNGSFDRNEFIAFFKPKLPSFPHEKLTDLFEAFDTDKSGTLEFKELVVALSIIGKGTPEDKLAIIFETYDQDKSGTLESTEIKKMTDLMVSVGKAMGKSEKDVGVFIEKLLEKIDKDHSKTITKKEWIEEGSKSPSLLVLLGVTN